MQKLILSLAVLVLSLSFAASSSQTNIHVMDNNKYLFGEKANNADVQLIGVNSDDRIQLGDGTTVLNLAIATSDATLTTGNINLAVIIGGVTYNIKAHTSE